MAPLFSLLDHIGDMAAFSMSAVRGALRRTGTLGAVMLAVGYSSVPVILVTGTFIGMVLAVQAYDQFAALGMATRLGVIINVSVVKELGPVQARASTWSVTRIVASSAAMALPTRPASMTPANTGPSSRTTEMLMMVPRRVARPMEANWS